jgi:hypothetical protein
VSTVKTARIEKRERTGFVRANNWTGAAQYEWVAWLFVDGEATGTRKITRTKRELVEWCAELGYEVTA